MKKYTKVLALALALTMMLSMSVFAEGTIGSAAPVIEYAEEVTIGAADGEEGYVGKDKLSVAYNGTAENAMYLLLVLTDTYDPNDPEAEPLSESYIKYVNQATADANGDVTFDKVYPADIVDSVVYLAGGDFTSGLTAVANITKYEVPKPDGMKGDVDLNGEVTAGDATLLLRHIAKITTITDAQALANAEVTGDTELAAADATKILRYVAKIIGSLD